MIFFTGLLLGFIIGAVAVLLFRKQHIVVTPPEIPEIVVPEPAPTPADPNIAAMRDLLAAIADRVEQGSRSQEDVSRVLYKSLMRLQTQSDQVVGNTDKLSGVLTNNSTRGRWGEVQLGRLVEAAGMMRRVSFNEQVSADIDGTARKPDMEILLTDNRKIFVDSKVPLNALLENPEAKDAHRAALRAHVDSLAAKNYWAAETTAPAFVVMFLPAESLLSAALDSDELLLEYAMRKNVIVATPSSLLALLHTVAASWQQHDLAVNATEILALNKELFTRLNSFMTHLTKMRSNVTGIVDGYNKALSSWNTRVVPTAGKVSDLGVGAAQLSLIPEITQEIDPSEPRES